MLTSCTSAAALTSLFTPSAFFEAVASTVSVRYIGSFYPALTGFSRQVMDKSHDIVRDVKKIMLDALHAREDISGRVRGYRVESRTKGLVSTFRKVRYLFLRDNAGSNAGTSKPIPPVHSGGFECRRGGFCLLPMI